jgi:hypothetical protein
MEPSLGRLAALRSYNVHRFWKTSTTGWRDIRSRLACTCFLACVLGIMFVGSSACASTGYVDGISDQSLPRWDGGFSGSYFAGFFTNTWINPPPHVQYARYVVQWNVMYKSTEKPYNEEPYTNYRQQFEEWLTDAGGMGLTLEIAVTEYSGTPYPSSSAEYRSRLKEILNQADAQGHPISYLEPWNEPNGQGGESAVAAAHFANEGNGACNENPKCTIVAGNVEDSSSVAGYLKEYRENLNFTPSNWGVHPYWSVEEREEKYYNDFLEGLPGKGSGDHIWFTEVAARRCTSTKNNDEIGQAERAKWLVNTLMPYAKPEHVFYWEFLLGERKQPTCSETDDALYVTSSDPNAPDAPRPAAAFIYGGSGFPWGYTGAPTVINGEEATLTGSLYPGGVLTAKYHFEYGPTTSYGSYSSEGNAGSGLGGVGENTTIGSLVEGTTYHYRIAAWNTEGADYGTDATFTTLHRPTVTTEEATNTQLTAAAFHGKVDPNGSSTNYHFEYGVGTGYGASTAEVNVGSGDSGTSVEATVTGLECATTYHFRLVATNAAGTSYGVDKIFVGQCMTQSAVVHDASTGVQWVYYVGRDHAIWQWAWSGTNWESHRLGGEVASNTSPVAVFDESNGVQWLYYVNKKHETVQWAWNLSTWESHTIGGEVLENTGLSTVFANTGVQWVYYANKKYEVVQWAWNLSTWESHPIGGEVA